MIFPRVQPATTSVPSGFLKHAPEAHFAFIIHYCDISYLSRFCLPLPLLLALQTHDAFHDHVDFKLLRTGPLPHYFWSRQQPWVQGPVQRLCSSKSSCISLERLPAASGAVFVSRLSVLNELPVFAIQTFIQCLAFPPGKCLSSHS